jgi:nitrous oxide reductase accessory protein NosL
MKGKLFIIAAALLIINPGLAHCRSKREACSVCGMYINQYQRTAVTLVHKDGKQSKTCGVADMIRLINDTGGPGAFSSIKVRGWSSGREINARDAVYVIGSRIIPDMLPTIIAFTTRKEAQAFTKKNGGALLSFTQALLSISPTGMTKPAKIKTAITPAKGAVGFSVGYMYMEMDDIMDGSSRVDPAEFSSRPGQTKSGKEMTTGAGMYMLSYGINDNLALGIGIKELHKEMTTYTMNGKQTTISRNNGMGDIDINMRYNLWRNIYYSKFISLLIDTTMPTGNFELAYVNSPGLQIGAGSFSGTAGLIYSQRISDLWLHAMLTYRHRLENSDNYRFGDETNFGAAIHYTPNYNFMFGLELNGVDYARNEYNDVELGNTGGFRSYATGVSNWRFLTAMGGNFNLRLSVSVPLYEDMNHYDTMGMEKAQLGGGYSGSALLSFKRRFNP